MFTLGAAAALAGFFPYLLSPKKGVGQVRGAPVKAAGCARPRSGQEDGMLEGGLWPPIIMARPDWIRSCSGVFTVSSRFALISNLLGLRNAGILVKFRGNIAAPRGAPL